MEIINEWPLRNGISIVQLKKLPSDVVFEQAKKYLSSDYPMLSRFYGLDETSKDKLTKISERLKDQFTIQLGVMCDNQIVGWTDGWQDSIERDTFFMGASLVVPSFRRQGIYSELLKKILDISNAEGFQSVSSLHIMTNNPILIAKLKMGFSIYGFEVNTRYGALLRMIYHHNEEKRKALRFRAGGLNEVEIYNALKGT